MMSEQPKPRGGARPGSGPKPKGRVKRDVSLPPELWAMVEAYRLHHGIKTMGEAVEQVLMRGMVFAKQADNVEYY